MGESTFILFLGVLEVAFIFISMEFLCVNVVQRPIWGYAVCIYLTKRTPGLNELKLYTYLV